MIDGRGGDVNRIHNSNCLFMKKILTTIIFVCLGWFLSAQDTLSWSLRQREDLLFRFEELINDDESNQEEVEELMVEEQEKFQDINKVNVNTLTPELAFGFLKITDYQYYNLISYLAEYGPMVSVYELNAVEGFSYDDVRRLQPLLLVDFVNKKKNFFKN